MRSPGFIRRPIAVAGDKVMIVGGRGMNEWDMVGYLLPSAPDVVRLAHQSQDDDRDNPPDDWFRGSFVRSAVIVVLLRRRPWRFA